MKGQYFMVGALIFCSLVFVALSVPGGVTRTKSDDLSLISGNLKREFPRSVNLGMKDNNPDRGIYDFTKFVSSSLKERSISFRCFWVMSKPVSGTSTINVSIANFLGSAGDFYVEISGDRRSIHLEDGEMKNTIFALMPSDVVMSVYSPEENRTLNWKRGKINLYLFYETSRRESISRNSIEA